MKVEVQFDVQEVSLKVKMREGKLMTQVALETTMSPIAIARLLALQRQQVLLQAIIFSNQEAMDLWLEDIREAKKKEELKIEAGGFVIPPPKEVESTDVDPFGSPIPIR